MSLMGLFVLAVIFYSASGGEQLGVVLLTSALSAVVFIFASLLIGYRRHTQRRMFSALLAFVLSLSVIVSVALTDWPLRITYAWSRASLDAVSERVRLGEQVITPLRVGLFNIQRAELSERGIVCLWTEPHPSGSTGFVQCSSDDVPFNLWSHTSLDEHWQFISED